jgi:hypothetical protein
MPLTKYIRGKLAASNTQVHAQLSTPEPAADGNSLNGRTARQAPASTARAPNVRGGTPSNRSAANPASTNTPQWQETQANVARHPTARPLIGRTEEQRQQARDVERSLSEVAAKIERLERSNDPRASELRRLGDSVRSLQYENAGKAQIELDDLQRRADGYCVSRAGADHLQQVINDYQRWGKDCKALCHTKKKVEKQMAQGKHTSAIELLEKTLSGHAHAHSRLLLEHKQHAAVVGLDHTHRQIESTAQRALPLLPQLQPLIASYHQAWRNVETAIAGAPEAFVHACGELANAEESLLAEFVRQLSQTNDPLLNQLDRQLYEVLDSEAHDIMDKARLVEPQNLEQTFLRRGLANDLKLAEEAKVPRARIRMARDLLVPGNPRNSIVTQRAAAPGEAEYFRRLYAENDLLQAAGSHPTQRLEGAEQAAWEGLQQTLRQVPTWDTTAGTHDRDAVIATEEAAVRADPARYANGLQLLATAKEQATSLARLAASRLEQRVDQIDGMADVVQKQQAASAFLMENASRNARLPGMLAMQASHQIKLLDALRGGLKQERLTPEQRGLQSQVYKLMKLDPAFLAKEASVRSASVEGLMGNHKLAMQRARDEWPALPGEKKREIIQLVVRTHCKAAGFAEPAKIDFGDTGSSTVAALWSPGSRRLLLNSQPEGLKDFETTMNTVFHENSHNWQFEIRAGLHSNSPQITRDSGLYQQAQIFDATLTHYDAEGSSRTSAYREQPAEAHAFFAGPRFARDLMSALEA